MEKEQELSLAQKAASLLFSELKSKEEEIRESVKELAEWLEYLALQGDQVDKYDLTFFAKLRFQQRLILDFLKDEDE